MILKLSKLAEESQTQITVRQLQEEALRSQKGSVQDKWWIEVDGQSATLYTDYYNGQPDRLSQAMRAVGERGIVLVHKTKNPNTGKSAYKIYSHNGQGWVPFTGKTAVVTRQPPAEIGQRQAGPGEVRIQPKQAPVVSIGNGERKGKTKETSIVLQKCIHAAGTVYSGTAASPEVVFNHAVRLLELHNAFVDGVKTPGTPARVAEMIEADYPQRHESEGFGEQQTALGLGEVSPFDTDGGDNIPF